MSKEFGLKRIGSYFLVLAILTIVSASAFATISSVTVTSPNGGELWSGTHNITWTEVGDTDNINLYYTTNGWATSSLIASGIPAGTLTYAWDTSLVADDDNYMIKVRNETDPDVFDLSNAVFEIENTAPTATTVSIASDNDNNSSLATTGNTITLTIVTDENIDVLTATIAGEDAEITEVDPQNWTATLTVSGDEEDGTVAFSIDFNDMAGNDATTVTETTDASSVEIDLTAPTYIITYSNDGPVKSGATVTITATFSEDMNSLPLPKIALSVGTGNPATVSATNMTLVSATEYTYEWTVGAGNGNLIPTVTLGIDLAGNAIADDGNTQTQIEVDNTLPTYAITYSDNGPVKENDVVTITATFSEDMNSLPLPKIALTQVGDSDATEVGATNMTLSSATEYTYTWEVGSGDGNLIPTVTLGIDLAENAIADDGNTQTQIEVDNTAPTASVALDDSALKVGDTATVTITFSELVTGLDGTDFAVGNGSLDGLTSEDGIVYTGTFTPTDNLESGTNVITLDKTGVADAAGNPGVGDESSANYTIDTKEPTYVITYSNNGPVKEGDVVTITATFSEDMNSLPLPKIALTQVGDSDATEVGATNMTLSSATEYTYEWTVAAGGDGNLEPTVTVGIDGNENAIDSSGNTQTQIEVDNTDPVIGAVSIYPFYDDGTNWVSELSSITASITETNLDLNCEYNLGSGWVAGEVVDGNCSVADIDTSSATAINIRATDTAGNVGTGSAITVSVDGTAPSSVDNVPSGWQTSPVTVDINCVDADSGCGTVNVSYTPFGGATIDITPSVDGDGNYPFTISTDGNYVITYYGTDYVGNAESANTATNNLLLDQNGPVVDAGDAVVWTKSIINIDATATDATSGIASYAWSMQSGPTGGVITFGSSTSEDTTVFANMDGNYVIRLTVTDNAGNSSYDQFDLIWESTAPVFRVLTPSTAGEGTVTIVMEATDETAFDLTPANNLVELTVNSSAYSGSLTYTGSDINNLKMQLEEDLSIGTNIIYVQIKDAAGNLKDATFNIAVSDSTAPTIDFNDSGSGCDYFYITVDINDDSTDRLNVWSEYNIVGMEGREVTSITKFYPGQQISIMFDAAEATDYNYTLYVSDASGNVADYNVNFSTTTCTTYDYLFEFPGNGLLFTAGIEEGWFSETRLNNIGNFDAMTVADFLNSNGGPSGERSDVNDFEIVYVYNNETSAWTTVDDSIFSSTDMNALVGSLNYIVFDLVSPIPSKAIRFVTEIS